MSQVEAANAGSEPNGHAAPEGTFQPTELGQA
jgi:hypothetical protein